MSDEPKNTSSHFIEDIVIYTNDNKAKLLKHEALQDLPDVGEAENEDLEAVVENLVRDGVVVAAIPSQPGIGSICYFLNLQAIVKPKTREE